MKQRARLVLIVAVVVIAVAGAPLAGPAASMSPPHPQIVPTPTPTPVPGDSQHYRNKVAGFSLTLPEGWVAQETGFQAPVLVVDVGDGELLINIRIFVYTLEEPVSAKEWLQGEVSSYGGDFITLLDESAVQLGRNTVGYQATIDWEPATGTAIKEQWTGVVRDTKVFLIRVFGVSSSFEGSIEPIDAFVSSFTLEEPQPPEPSLVDTLNLYAGEIVTLDPALYRGSAAGVPGAIFSGLVTLDRDLKVAPDIAESWEMAGNGSVITFYLRPDAIFHDGKPVTAHDFKYSWERAADPDTGSPTARTYLGDIVGVKQKLDGQAAEVVGVQVLDDLTLQVTLDAPKPYFLQKLTYPTAYVVDRANVDSGDSWADDPNGTGPFKLESWDKGERLVLERNDSYYKKLPNLFQVVYKLFAGRPMTLYEEREIDVAGVQISDIDRTRDPASELNADLRQGPTFCTTYLAFNVTMPPFDDVNVRRAFALALDIDKELAVSLKGVADRASGFVPPGVAAHNRSLTPVPFDPDLAVSLLEQSRYRGVDDLPPIVSFAADDAMHWMWTEYLGVEVEAVSLPEPEDFHSRLDADELPLWSSQWCADYPDPQNFLEVLFHSGSQVNHFGYSNAEVDALLNRAAIEADPEARTSMYQQAERLVLDDWVAVPLWHARNYVLVRPHVKGYQVSPIGVPYLQYIFFER